MSPTWLVLKKDIVDDGCDDLWRKALIQESGYGARNTLTLGELRSRVGKASSAHFVSTSTRVSNDR